MDNDTEKCYPNVNEPELIYPYADVVTADLTPVDPETLVNQNLAKLREKLSPQRQHTNKARHIVWIKSPHLPTMS